MDDLEEDDSELINWTHPSTMDEEDFDDYIDEEYDDIDMEGDPIIDELLQEEYGLALPLFVIAFIIIYSVTWEVEDAYTTFKHDISYTVLALRTWDGTYREGDHDQSVLFGSYGFVPEEGDKKRIKLLELAYKKKVHRFTLFKEITNEYWFTSFQHRYTYSYDVYRIGYEEIVYNEAISTAWGFANEF